MIPITDPRLVTLTRLAALPGAETPTIIDDEGTIRIGFEWAITTIYDVLECLPGEHTRRFERFAELCDYTGEGVDYEYEEGVYACDAERSLFIFCDHYQAGLSCTVELCATDEAYQRELKSMLEDRIDVEGEG